MTDKNMYKLFFRTEKNYLKIVLSNIIGRFGDSIDSIAYGWMVYQLTGSTAWLAVVMGVNSIPTIIFQPFAGAIVEFFSKKKIVIICDISRGAVVLLTGILLIAGVLEPWHLLILTFSNSCFEAFRLPTGLTIVSIVLHKDYYKIGLSLNQTACRIAELIGLGCAGAVVAWFGAGGALVIDALTFFISASIFIFLKLPVTKNKNDSKNISFKNYRNDLTEGVRYFKKNQIALIICMIGFLLNITAVPLENLQAAYVNECLKLGVSALSVGSSFMTIGLILGSALFAVLSKYITNKFIFMFGGSFIGGVYLGLILIGTAGNPLLKYILYGLLLFAFGFVNSIIGMAVQVTILSVTPEEYIGRVGSIFNAMACSSLPIGSFLVAAILPFIPLAQTYILVGLITIIIFTIFGRLKTLRKLE